MDRSFVGRLGVGGVRSRPRRTTASRGASARRAGGAIAVDRAIAVVWRLPGAGARSLTGAWALARAHRRLRIALLVAVVAVPLLAGGWLWLRNSSLVAVSHVQIVGAHGADAAAIDAALTQAARRMSTLDVNTGELRAAVAGYPVVGQIEAHASFPHSLSIRVIEQPAVAILSVAGTKTAVAADGVVLGPAHVSGALPSVPDKTPLSVGERVENPSLLMALTVLGAVPAPLLRDVERAYSGPKGLTVVLHGGLRTYFGDASRPHAKWLALARVLADSSSAGATYVDVRVPERPAAGFPAGVKPPSGSSETEASSTTPPASESSQALAEGLSSAVSPSASTSGPPSPAEREEAASKEHEQAPSSSGEAESSSTSSGAASAAGTGEGH